jgi:hypothetical protein
MRAIEIYTNIAKVNTAQTLAHNRYMKASAARKTAWLRHIMGEN